MTTIYDLPPADPVLFDLNRDAVGDGGAVVLATTGSESERWFTPECIGGNTDIRVEMRIRTSNLPPYERIPIAMMAGVLLELDDDGLHWPWRNGLDGTTSDRLTEPFAWEPERWYELKVHGQMRSDTTGTLELWIDNRLVGQLVAVQTWSLDNPRSWMAGVVNVRPEVAAGQFDVEMDRLVITKEYR